MFIVRIYIFKWISYIAALRGIHTYIYNISRNICYEYVCVCMTEYDAKRTYVACELANCFLNWFAGNYCCDVCPFHISTLKSTITSMLCLLGRLGRKSWMCSRWFKNTIFMQAHTHSGKSAGQHSIENFWYCASWNWLLKYLTLAKWLPSGCQKPVWRMVCDVCRRFDIKWKCKVVTEAAAAAAAATAATILPFTSKKKPSKPPSLILIVIWFYKHYPVIFVTIIISNVIACTETSPGSVVYVHFWFLSRMQLFFRLFASNSLLFVKLSTFQWFNK